MIVIGSFVSPFYPLNRGDEDWTSVKKSGFHVWLSGDDAVNLRWRAWPLFLHH